MKKTTFAVLMMVAFIATGCNNHPSSSGGDLNNNANVNENNNFNQNTNNVNNNQADDGFKVITGSYGMIALRSSETGQDDFGPGAESVDYTFYFDSPGVAVVAATDDIDLWSEENVEVWPVIDVAAFKTVIRTYFHLDSPTFMTEEDLKAALAAFVCSDVVDRPDLAPMGCPEYYVPSEEFLYWDYAAEFTWEVYDYEDVGIVFILKE